MGLFTRTDTVSLRVTGMTCGHCQQRVRDALEDVPGVERADVDLDGGSARVKYKPGQASVDAMVRAVEGAGYTAEAP